MSVSHFASAAGTPDMLTVVILSVFLITQTAALCVAHYWRARAKAAQTTLLHAIYLGQRGHSASALDEMLDWLKVWGPGR